MENFDFQPPEVPVTSFTIETTHDGHADYLSAPVSVIIHNNNHLTRHHYWELCRSDLNLASQLLKLIRPVFFISRNLIKFLITNDPLVDGQKRKLRILLNKLHFLECRFQTNNHGSFEQVILNDVPSGNFPYTFKDLKYTMQNMLSDLINSEMGSLEDEGEKRKLFILLHGHDLYMQVLQRHYEDLRIFITLVHDVPLYMRAMRCSFSELDDLPILVDKIEIMQLYQQFTSTEIISLMNSRMP